MVKVKCIIPYKIVTQLFLRPFITRKIKLGMQRSEIINFYKEGLETFGEMLKLKGVHSHFVGSGRYQLAIYTNYPVDVEYSLYKVRCLLGYIKKSDALILVNGKEKIINYDNNWGRIDTKEGHSGIEFKVKGKALSSDTMTFRPLEKGTYLITRITDGSISFLVDKKIMEIPTHQALEDKDIKLVNY